jgi:hypothetical protein
MQSTCSFVKPTRRLSSLYHLTTKVLECSSLIYLFHSRASPSQHLSLPQALSVTRPENSAGQRLKIEARDMPKGDLVLILTGNYKPVYFHRSPQISTTARMKNHKDLFKNP